MNLTQFVVDPIIETHFMRTILSVFSTSVPPFFCPFTPVGIGTSGKVVPWLEDGLYILDLCKKLFLTRSCFFLDSIVLVQCFLPN